MRKLMLFSALAVLMLSAAAEAAEQRAFALMSPVTVYAKTNRNSESWQADIPEKGVVVPSAARDKNNRLWYSVTLNGKKGWLPQEGIRLKMGGKSKFAANAAKRCAKLCESVINGKAKGWSEGSVNNADSGMVTTWRMKGGMLQVLETATRTSGIYFRADNNAACTAMLGFNAVGMDTAGLRGKVGTPTVRETPADEPDVNILSYETDGMTMAIHLRDEIVEYVELFRGATGAADDGWPTDVLIERE